MQHSFSLGLWNLASRLSDPLVSSNGVKESNYNSSLLNYDIEKEYMCVWRA